MAGTPLKNLRMFEELCGKNAFHNVILVTTMWDEVDEETGEDREEELKTKYWRTMLERSSTTSRFLRTRESAFDIIEPLIDEANTRSSLLLQGELVDMRKSLPATAAGQELFSAMGQLVSQREDLLRRIRYEMRHSGNDKMALEPLQEEHQKLKKSLEDTVIEMRRLRLPLGKRVVIMTDKFFSIKFEFLKSWITKRLSKSTTRTSIEPPPPLIDPSPHVPVSHTDPDHVSIDVISLDPNGDYTPQSPTAWTSPSHTPDNTVHLDQTTYPTRHGSSPLGQEYPNYDRSHAPDNTVFLDRTAYPTRHGSSPPGQENPSYDRSHTPRPDNIVSSDRMYPTRHGSSPLGQEYPNYDHSHTPGPVNTLSSDQTYPTRYGSSPIEQEYPNYNHSHTSGPVNTLSSDQTYPTRYGSSPVGQGYQNYDHSLTQDNTVSLSDQTLYTTGHPHGQAYQNYDRELQPRPPAHHGGYSQSHPYNSRSQNPNYEYQS